MPPFPGAVSEWSEEQFVDAYAAAVVLDEESEKRAEQRRQQDALRTHQT